MTPRLAGPGASVLARWAGRCAACNRPIERGDLIRRDGREWLHASCHREPTEGKR